MEQANSGLVEYESGNLYYDVPDEIYYNRPEISNSDLKLIGESPKDWVSGVREQTKAMEDGRDFHCYIGERDKFKKNYLITRKLHRGTTEWKTLVKENPDKKLMQIQDFKKLFWTKRSANSDVNAEALLSLEGHSEVAGFFDYLGVKCRFKADRIVRNGDAHIIIDYKKVSTRNNMYLTQDTIERYNRSYNCVQQAAFYRHGYEAITGVRPLFVNIYFEMNDIKAKSLGCVAALMPEDLLIGERGEGAFHDAMLKYKHYQENGWPTHSEFIIKKQLEMGIITGTIPSIGIGGWV